jgi:hypothetical protein
MRIFWFLAVAFIPMYLYGQSAPPDNMETLKSLLEGERIRKVEILRVPDGLMTRTSVTPDDMRALASYSVIFNDDFESTLSSTFSETSFKRSSQSSDLRWGILFYNASGHEIGSVFVDKFGKYGYVNKETVQFGSNLAKRLHQIIQDLP